MKNLLNIFLEQSDTQDIFIEKQGSKFTAKREDKVLFSVNSMDEVKNNILNYTNKENDFPDVWMTINGHRELINPEIYPPDQKFYEQEHLPEEGFESKAQDLIKILGNETKAFIKYFDHGKWQIPLIINDLKKKFPNFENEIYAKIADIVKNKIMKKHEGV